MRVAVALTACCGSVTAHQVQPAQVDTTPQHQPPAEPARTLTPPRLVAIEIDGKNQNLLVEPPGFFDSLDVENFLAWEIRLDANGNYTKNTQYPNEPLDEFFANRWDVYRAQLMEAAKIRWPDPEATGYGVLGYENGLTLEARRADPVYKEGLTNSQYEKLARKFFIESIRACREARPNVKWTIWFQPHQTATHDEFNRHIEFYQEVDWLAIPVYSHIGHGGSFKHLEKRILLRGERVGWVREVHRLGDQLEAVAFPCGRYQNERKLVPTEEIAHAMLFTEWANFFCIWQPAGDKPKEAQVYQQCILPGGNVYDAVELYRLLGWK